MITPTPTRDKRRYKRPLRALLLATLSLLAVGGARADAQYRQVVVDADPAARMVALAIRFPTGSTEDPRGEEGTAFLLGRIVERRGVEELAPYGSSVGVITDSEEFLVLLVAEPSRWGQALRQLERVLYQTSTRAEDLNLHRAELSQVLRFEAGAPVRAFERERVSFLLGRDHPSARPPLGTSDSIERIGIPELEAFRSTHIRPERAVVAVSGPVEEGELAALLPGSGDNLVLERDQERAPPASLAAADTVLSAPRLSLHRADSAPLRVPAESPGPPAWMTGERRLLDRDLTSTWISVAFPFPLGTPDLLLDFLGHLIIEDLTPSPPYPGLFEAHFVRTTVVGAPVLVVTASVDPRSTSRWEGRLVMSLADLAETPPDGPFFELARRRFRSVILLEHALPEKRAGWMARQVASGLDPSSALEIAIWSLERSAIGQAAAAAGPARTILMGPSAMMDR